MAQEEVLQAGEKAYREKCWSELNIEEKIERMRQVIKNLERKAEFQGLRMDKLMQHTHVDGEIFISLQDDIALTPGRLWRGDGTSKDDVWF